MGKGQGERGDEQAMAARRLKTDIGASQLRRCHIHRVCIIYETIGPFSGPLAHSD